MWSTGSMGTGWPLAPSRRRAPAGRWPHSPRRPHARRRAHPRSGRAKVGVAPSGRRRASWRRSVSSGAHPPRRGAEPVGRTTHGPSWPREPSPWRRPSWREAPAPHEPRRRASPPPPRPSRPGRSVPASAETSLVLRPESLVSLSSFPFVALPAVLLLTPPLPFASEALVPSFTSGGSVLEREKSGNCV